MIFITGDTHGTIDMLKLGSKSWPIGQTLTKKDYLIVAGDFGLLWSSQIDEDEKRLTRWLEEKPWTTLFIDGNHENHQRLSRLRKVKKFGGIAGRVSSSIFHLRRGEIYTIEGKSFFCFGGGDSIDKKYRTEGVSWWREEIPSQKEQQYALANLEKHDNTVDYVIAHTCPMTIFKMTGLSDYSASNKDTENFLEFVCNTIEFEEYYCGHLHLDKNFGKYHLLYKNIVRVI